MSKIGIIIQREYLSRVKKKSFIVMTLVVPILFTVLIGGAVSMMMSGRETHFIEVVDESGVFADQLKSTNDVRFEVFEGDILAAKKGFYNTPYDVILFIPYKADQQDVIKNGAQLFFKQQPGILLQEVIRQQLLNILYDYQLEQNGIDRNKVDIARNLNIAMKMTKIDETGYEEDSDIGVAYGIGFISGLLIYIFILLYGIQVMRGVIEEKSNRIIEVIISSVKPFQLMMGKIIGIAMVGLTQFLIWVIFSAVMLSVGQDTFLKKYYQATVPEYHEKISTKKNAHAAQFESPQEKAALGEVGQALNAITDPAFLVKLLGCFLFYFLGGYLLYSAMFAAFGAAVDSETETQQFMMPVTLPLILAYIISVFIMQNPNSPVAVWCSIIPFTSPIVMMARLPFNVPMWEILVSMTLLVVTFVFMTWLAGKIYRTGILMYGKKVSYKELWKWLRYSG